MGGRAAIRRRRWRLAVFHRDPNKINQFVQKFSNRGRLTGIALCDARDEILSATAELAPDLAAITSLAKEALQTEKVAR